MPLTVLQVCALAEMSVRRLGYVIVDDRDVWAEDVRRDASVGARVAGEVFGIYALEIRP